MTAVVVRHAEGDDPPLIPQGEIRLEPPPELPETTSDGFVQTLMYLPMAAMGVGMVAVIAGGHASPVLYLGSGAMAVGMTGMMAAQVLRGKGDRKLKLNGLRRDYLRYLAQIRRKVRRAAAQQRAAMQWHAPDPESLQSLLASGHDGIQPAQVWHRHPGDPGFMQVRLATGTQELAVTLTAPETKPVEDLDPLCTGALLRFLKTSRQLPGLPVGASLRTHSRVVPVGDLEQVRALVRAMIAQIAVTHSPADVRICVCAPPEVMQHWEWVKWLPHNQHPHDTDAAGPARLLAPGLPELEGWLRPDLRERPRLTAGTTPSLPFYVIVVDGCPDDRGPELDGIDGVVLINMGTEAGSYEHGTLGLAINGSQLFQRATDPRGSRTQALLGAFDQLSLAEAEALARQLAPLRPASVTPDEDTLASNTTIASLLGISDPRALDVRTLWRPRPARDRLRVPVGNDIGGQPVELDIKEAAQGGMGPHGLVIGATGSGKSELLRTIVLGQALTHPPEELNFVLVDFKGGATFLGLDRLHHVAAVITNLSEELPLVDRMNDALNGEIVRRQQLLRDAGNYASLRDYVKDGARLGPLPVLFVVIDEFSELLAAKPEFTDLFVTIGRVGRSLGVHLLLASQRLEEHRLHGLETQLSYRIGLRTFSAAESRLVLGVPDAYELPAQPGNAYLKTDATDLTRFKAAYTSGPIIETSHQNNLVAHQPGQRPVPFTPWPVSPSPGAPPRANPATLAAAPVAAAQSLLDVVVAQLAGKGRPAHQIWLPPLAEAPVLGSLLGEAGLGELGAVIGIVDRPFEQRRDPLLVDLSASAGHFAVVGGPLSGKSTLLRTLVCSLALQYSPADVQFYMLDFGGGSLAALDGLPHVGGVASRQDGDRVRRTVAEVRAILEQRERSFAEQGIDSITAYRQLRASGQIDGDGFGDVFLVADGWLTLRQDYEELEPVITALAARGLGYGVHVIAASGKWSEFRPAVRDLFGTCLELRLGDPAESAVGRMQAANVPVDVPGRGLTKDGLHFISALPSLDESGDVSGLVRAVGVAWHGAPAPAVRMLPAEFSAAELPGPGQSGSLIPIGIDENALAPVCLDLEGDPHFLVFGDTESGKSNLLRLVASSLAARYAPDAAKMIFIDYRRSLLDTSEIPHQIGYATSSVAAAGLLAEVQEAMAQRLPPPDLSADELRARSWWKGSDLFLIVDDYDLVAGAQNPLLVLLELLPQARDIGLHVVLARSAGGAGRAMFDPVIQRLREMGSPGLLLSGSRDEGKLLGGVTPVSLPTGRGYFIERRNGPRLIQTALADLPSAGPYRRQGGKHSGGKL
jgi:S-DNA-T family DNA segregation ATPase FtsK/SpoIIIE